MKTSIQTLEWRAAADNEILALLSQATKDKIWSEREIIDGLGHELSICALERLAATGKVKLTQNRNFTYLCQLL
jgi:hypothetical protein